jgi:hypothetical protein
MSDLTVLTRRVALLEGRLVRLSARARTLEVIASLACCAIVLVVLISATKPIGEIRGTRLVIGGETARAVLGPTEGSGFSLAFFDAGGDVKRVEIGGFGDRTSGLHINGPQGVDIVKLEGGRHEYGNVGRLSFGQRGGELVELMGGETTCHLTIADGKAPVPPNGRRAARVFSYSGHREVEIGFNPLPEGKQ